MRCDSGCAVTVGKPYTGVHTRSQVRHTTLRFSLAERMHVIATCVPGYRRRHVTCRRRGAPCRHARDNGDHTVLL